MQKKKGISLIVLAITIILMIILAGTVVLTLNNSGIIERAQEAVERMNLKQVQEIASVEWGNAYMSGAKTEDELEEAIRTALTKQKIDLNKYVIDVTTSGVEVKIRDENYTPIQFGKPYGFELTEGIYGMVVFYEDGSMKMYMDTTLMQVAPAGTFIYVGPKIIDQSTGEVVYTISEDGTQVVVDGNTFILGEFEDYQTCKIQFGKPYGFEDEEGIYWTTVFYEDGSLELYEDNTLKDSIPAGWAGYVGTNIIIQKSGEVVGTISEDGTQVVVDGNTYILGEFEDYQTCKIQFGKPYVGEDEEGIYWTLVFYEDGSSEYWMDNTLSESLPAGWVGYVGTNIIDLKMDYVFATVSTDGTQVVFNGNTYILGEFEDYQ